MKFPLLFFLLLSFSLSPAFSKSQKDKPASRLSSKKENKRNILRKIQSRKKSRRKVSTDSIKIKILGTSYYKPKKTARELSMELNDQLKALESVCDSKNSPEELKIKLKNFRDFLKDNLSDPYMIYKYKLEFVGILDLIGSEEDKTPLSPDSFNSSYKSLYNIPENKKPGNYHHEWAQVLLETLKCSAEPSAK